jgi:hypothetical protein
MRTDTAADRRLPVVRHGNGVARNERSRNPGAGHKSPLEGGALEVAFDAEHPGAGLPIVTNLTAADEGRFILSSVAKGKEAEWRKPNNLVEEKYRQSGRPPSRRRCRRYRTRSSYRPPVAPPPAAAPAVRYRQPMLELSLRPEPAPRYQVSVSCS